jgi:sugar phosphate isomerase/epimerase
MAAPELLASYWTICGAAEPHTEREYSPFTLRERAASASRAGFTGLGIWHADLAHLRRQHSLPEIKQILDDHGIKHIELEFLTDCAEARDHGTRIVFEFMPFSRIETLADAIELCTGAAQPNGGICVDLWHVVKLGMPYSAVAAFPKPYLMSIELNDGYRVAPPGMELVTETTCHRAFCGEGEFDVRGFVDAMRPAYAGPWGIEVLNKAQRAWPLDELTTRAFATTRAMFRD